MDTQSHPSVDANHMSLALQLAERGRFTVSPNPMVGCVIVKNNQIIGQGFHQYTGGPHAEVLALREAKNEAKGSTAYVTLEPCCHHGRTPPCTNQLIEVGVKCVVVACVDPNPKVAGKGIKALESAGIEVKVGVLEQEARALNEIFFHYMKQKKPFVIAKWAMSLDGKTSIEECEDKQISGCHSKKITHDLREQVDAILVGGNTVLFDNPILTARNHEQAKQPIRIVLAAKKHLDEHLNLFTDGKAKTIIASTKDTHKFVAHIKSNHVDHLILPENKHHHIHLESLLDELAKREITSVLVEGGMTVHESFLAEDLVNKLYVYVAPKLKASFSRLKSVAITNNYQAGDDFHFIANLKESSHV